VHNEPQRQHAEKIRHKFSKLAILEVDSRRGHLYCRDIPTDQQATMEARNGNGVKRMRVTHNCNGCETPMWLEGQIDDDIPLCHACYLQYAESGALEEYFPS
jgi:hypothetical protein